MPKINQEEYEVLKGLDDKWKWIARNYNGALITYTDKPTKNPNLYWDSFGERMDDRLFQFIQWEDESPYNIQELIEEYLYDNQPKLFIDGQEQSFEFIEESEETEVKKDIEWLKREIHKELEDWHGVEGGIDGDGINEIMLLINQLDEPEVLSQEWIDKNKFEVNGWNEAVHVEDLQNLLVPKQEVTIGKEDAENIVQYKEMGWTLSHLIGDYGENARHDELLAKAWLAYPNIEVEQEPKYRIKTGDNYLYFNLDGTVRGSTKKNAVISKERLEKLPFDVEKAVESRIIEIEEVEE